MRKLHVSVDLETLSVRPDAVILSIGAVAFLEGADLQMAEFYTPVRIAPQTGLRNIQPKTLEWWKNKAPAARTVFEECERHDTPRLGEALQLLTKWLSTMDAFDVYMWGNGSSFDIAILEHAFLQWGYEVPWKFHNVRDMRTLKDLTERRGLYKRIPMEGVAHNALDDARHQAIQIRAMLKAMSL